MYVNLDRKPYRDLVLHIVCFQHRNTSLLDMRYSFCHRKMEFELGMLLHLAACFLKSNLSVLYCSQSWSNYCYQYSSRQTIKPSEEALKFFLASQCHLRLYLQFTFRRAVILWATRVHWDYCRNWTTEDVEMSSLQGDFIKCCWVLWAFHWF